MPPTRKVEIDPEDAEMVLLLEVRIPLEGYDDDDVERALDELRGSGSCDIKSKRIIGTVKD